MVIAGGDREWNLVSEVEVKGIWSLWLMSLVSMEANRLIILPIDVKREHVLRRYSLVGDGVG